jgi:hypothetical protein
MRASGEHTVGNRGAGATGWGQRPSDFRAPDPGHDPPPGRWWVQPLWWAGGALAFAAALTALTAWLTSDRADLAGEIEQRSQAPTVRQARLVEDGLEVEISGHPEAAHCLDAPAAVVDLVPESDRCGDEGQSSFVVPLQGVDDPAALVDAEVVVRARSTITDRSDPELPSLDVESEPSAPAGIVDAR